MTKGWFGNKQAHSLASRGIKTSESRKTYNGMPHHKTIGGVKFNLRTTGRYWTKINITLSLTEEDAMFLYYFYGKYLEEAREREEKDVKDFKEFLKSVYDNSEYYYYEMMRDEYSFDDDDDEGWQEIKKNIDKQTKRNLEIIKEANNV